MTVESPGNVRLAGRSHSTSTAARRHFGLLTRRVQLLLDVSVLAGAFTVAYLLRFEFMLGPAERKRLIWQLPVIVLLQLLSQRAWGIYKFIWRYIGLSELRAFVGAALTCLAVMLGLRFGWPAGMPDLRVPISVTFIDVGLAFTGTLGIRVLRRMLFEWGEREREDPHRRDATSEVRVLLVGAGKAGVMAAREIQGGAMPRLSVKGFVDDDVEKFGSVISGIRVVGTSAEIPRLVEDLLIDEVILTIARASRAEIRRIVSLCEQTKVKVRIIPGLYEILAGKVKVGEIRNVEIEDLLGREAVKLDERGLHFFLSGKTVMVTGAGGSIGSELIRQAVHYSPLRLLLVERSEYALYQIEEEMRRAWPTLNVVPLLADVGDGGRMRDIFGEYRPQIVIHAAAHKHVPLVEWNPGEAVKNNIVGTLTTGELAGEFGAEAFVLISTDKAVNPTSVMGATKRAAELIVQTLDRRFKTAFLAVRFGNVLGSTGSVVPKFREQIARGGPVTVTHPEMRRYFMTIPEAAQLVLQAGALGKGGEIFILDMGQPVKVVDLASDMIHLSGLTPGEDIEIVFTGMRPGEKLFEELGTSADQVDRTRHEKIFVGRIPQMDPEKVMAAVNRMTVVVRDGDGNAVREELQRLIPEAVLTNEAREAEAGLKRRPSGSFRRLKVAPVVAIMALASASAWGVVAPPSPVTGLRLGPIGTGEAAMAVLFAPPAGTPCEERLRGTFSILGGGVSSAVDAPIAPSPEGGCAVPVTLRFDAVSADVLEHVKVDALDYRLSGEVGGAKGTRHVDWQGTLPRGAVSLVESMKVTLRRFVKVHDVSMGSVGFTKTTVNVSVDVFVPFRFDLRILEASCAVELNGRDVAAGKREKALLHAGRSSRMEIPVTFENGAVLAAAGKTMANKGKLEGRLKGIGRLKLPTGELDFPFDFPILISLL